MTNLSVWVAGRPAAQGSKKHIGHGRMVESSKYVGPWREHIANAVRTQPLAVRRLWPLQGPVQVRLSFVMPRPVNTPKRSTPPAVKKPDGDKLERAVWDALSKAGVWRDDAQVTVWSGSKRIAEIGEASGVLIEVAAVGVELTEAA